MVNSLDRCCGPRQSEARLEQKCVEYPAWTSLGVLSSEISLCQEAASVLYTRLARVSTAMPSACEQDGPCTSNAEKPSELVEELLVSGNRVRAITEMLRDIARRLEV